MAVRTLSVKEIFIVSGGADSSEPTILPRVTVTGTKGPILDPYNLQSTLDYFSIYDNYGQDQGSGESGENSNQEPDQPIDIDVLDADVDALINKSPTLVAAWNSLVALGYKVELATTAPSKVDEEKKVISIFVNGQSADYLAQSFAHEVGHAMRANAISFTTNADGTMSIMTLDQFLSEKAADEAYANLFQYSVASEMNVQLFTNYKDIYLAYQQSGDTQVALNAISSHILADATNEAGVKYVDIYTSYWQQELGPDSVFASKVKEYNSIILKSNTENDVGDNR